MRVSLSGTAGRGASPEVRRRVERQLRLVVGRRTALVSHVEVQMEPHAAPGSSGRGRQRCRIRAHLASGRTVEVEEAGASQHGHAGHNH